MQTLDLGNMPIGEVPDFEPTTRAQLKTIAEAILAAIDADRVETGGAVIGYVESGSSTVFVPASVSLEGENNFAPDGVYLQVGVCVWEGGEKTEAERVVDGIRRNLRLAEAVDRLAVAEAAAAKIRLEVEALREQ